MAQLLDWFEPGQEPAAFLAAGLQKAVVISHPYPPTHWSQVFQFHQFAQVNAQPGVSPMDGVSQFATAEGSLVGDGGRGFVVHELGDEA